MKTLFFILLLTLSANASVWDWDVELEMDNAVCLVGTTGLISSMAT